MYYVLLTTLFQFVLNNKFSVCSISCCLVAHTGTVFQACSNFQHNNQVICKQILNSYTLKTHSSKDAGATALLEVFFELWEQIDYRQFSMYTLLLYWCLLMSILCTERDFSTNVISILLYKHSTHCMTENYLNSNCKSSLRTNTVILH